MTQEEKAKRYSEALERAKMSYHTGDYDKDTLEMLEIIFPELRESEDEKIRNRILLSLEKDLMATKNSGCNTQDLEQCIAWLEKQGEQKPIDKIQLGKKYKCIASPRYSTFRRGNIYKPVDNFLCNLMNLCYECFEPIEDSEQKPTDEDMKEALRTEYGKGRADAFAEMQKEWSEEDENGLGDAIWCCKQAASIAKDENDMGNVWYAEHWLKSLKERYIWKPSDKQMKQLGWVAEQNKDNMIGKELMSLYQDLKKLKT